METPFIVTNAYATSPHPFYVVQVWTSALQEWLPLEPSKHPNPIDAHNVVNSLIRHGDNRRFRVVAYEPTVIRVHPHLTPAKTT